jgi:hypothetical protein
MAADPGSRFPGQGCLGRREHTAHEPLIAAVMVEGVPLTGLSFGVFVPTFLQNSKRAWFYPRLPKVGRKNLDHSPIVLDEESDAELAPNAETTWVGVGAFSIYIKKTKEGVIVDVYARGAEDCDSLASCHAFEVDAQSMLDRADDDT